MGRQPYHQLKGDKQHQSRGYKEMIKSNATVHISDTLMSVWVFSGMLVSIRLLTRSNIFIMRWIYANIWVNSLWTVLCLTDQSYIPCTWAPALISHTEVKQTPDDSSLFFETWLNLTAADEDLRFLLWTTITQMHRITHSVAVAGRTQLQDGLID